jgi:hypothetical protein
MRDHRGEDPKPELWRRSQRRKDVVIGEHHAACRLDSDRVFGARARRVEYPNLAKCVSGAKELQQKLAAVV